MKIKNMKVALAFLLGVSVCTLVGAAAAFQGRLQLSQIVGGTSANIPISNGTNLVSRTVSGAATISSTGVLTLADSGVSANTYGSALLIPQITVTAKGIVTGISTVAIQAYPTRNSFTGDGVATTFTLTGTPNYSEVFFNGQLLRISLTTGFSYTLSGTTLTIKQDNATYTCTSSDLVDAVWW